MNISFDPDCPVEEAWMPPSAWYRDPNFLDKETELILSRTWQFVGRAEQVANPGDYFTVDLFGESILVCRDEEGRVRGFFNVCRHHAALVGDGSGQAQEFVCPYHGWCYRLDGTLRKAPKLGPAKNFDRHAFGLTQLHLCEWGPLIGVCIGDERPPEPEDSWPDIHQVLEASKWSELVFVEHRSYEVNCNWKVYVDNYLDGGYHVSVLHPDLAGSLELSSYQTTLGQSSVLQCSTGADDAGRIGERADYGWVYPNFMLNRYGPVLDTNWVLPLGPEKCLVHFDFFFTKEAIKRREFVSNSLESSEKVQQEDIWISESVQRGLSSRSYERGRYAPKLEHGEFLFHQLIHRDVMARGK